MTEIDIRQIDPMVQDLWQNVRDHTAIGDPRIYADAAKLAGQLTERLKRPSREAFMERLSDFECAAPGLPKARERERLINLACGAEPKPKSVVTVGELFGACEAGNHDTCLGIYHYADLAYQVAKGGYCTCDCHKPD